MIISCLEGNNVQNNSENVPVQCLGTLYVVSILMCQCQCIGAD